MLASLDWLIALTLVFAFLSLLATALQELIASGFALRAKSLKKGISALLQNDPGLQKKFLASPFIRAMTGGTGKYPSYLQSPVFAQSLICVLRETWKEKEEAKQPGTAIDAASASVGQLIAAAPADLVPVLKQLLDQPANTAADELRLLESELAHYFDAGMERASGWFKRQTQLIILFLALVTSASLDADAFAMARRLAADAPMRAGLVSVAEQISATDDASSVQAKLADAKAGLPFGWEHHVVGAKIDWAEKVCGWILTALAISLGAPFWFDLLGKFMSLRSAMKPKPAKP